MPVNSGTAGTAISFSDLQSAYGGSHPISLSEYYRGGGEVPSSTTTTSTSVGALTTTTPGNPGSFVVTLNSSLSFVQVTQGGMGNHTVVQNGTQIYSASQDDLPTATLYFRGPAYQSGDTPGNPPFALASSGTVGFSGFRLPASIGRRSISTVTTTTQNNTNIPSSGTISLDTFNVPGTFKG